MLYPPRPSSAPAADARFNLEPLASDYRSRTPPGDTSQSWYFRPRPLPSTPPPTPALPDSLHVSTASLRTISPSLATCPGVLVLRVRALPQPPAQVSLHNDLTPAKPYGTTNLNDEDSNRASSDNDDFPLSSRSPTYLDKRTRRQGFVGVSAFYA
jgi:hypothetical protein